MVLKQVKKKKKTKIYNFFSQLIWGLNTGFVRFILAYSIIIV